MSATTRDHPFCIMPDVLKIVSRSQFYNALALSLEDPSLIGCEKPAG